MFNKLLLKKGLKVLLGGSLIKGYGTEVIRTLINQINLLTEVESKNLIIFEGYLDVNEDLYKIIMDGKDFVSNDFSLSKYTWEYFPDSYGEFEIEDNLSVPICVVYESGCRYKKCLHCTWKNTLVNNFTKTITVDDMYNNTKKLCEDRGTTSIIVHDGDVIFDDKLSQYCKRMKDEGYDIIFTTSIKNFLDIKNIEFYNDCASFINIGIDSCDDYCLSILNKKHRWEDIVNATKMIKQHLNPDIVLKLLMVIDAPYKNKDDIIQNYDRLIFILSELSMHMENMFISTYFLMNFPNLPLMNLKNYLNVESDEHVEFQNGMVGSFNKMRQYADFKFDHLQKIMKPFVRIDENNSFLKSDFEYLNDNQLSMLFDHKELNNISIFRKYKY